MYYQEHDMYPQSERYAASGEEGSIVDCLSSYIGKNREIFISPSTEASFKANNLSYVYNKGIERDPVEEWVLVCARLPESQNPHPGNVANILWTDGHVKAEEVELPEEE